VTAGGGEEAARFFVLDGQVVVQTSWVRWAREAEEAMGTEEWRVAYTRLEELYVSTVFTGIPDVRGVVRGDPEPLVFETGLFRCDGGGLVDVLGRWPSWEAAERAHALAVAAVREEQGNE